jgi:hypothetical protein
MSKVVLTLSLMAVAVASLTACQRQKRAEIVVGGHALVVSARLVCPEHQGRLDRIAQTPDGLSCRYSAPNGAEVVLSKTRLDGRPVDEVLQATERDLAALLPTPPSLQQPGKSVVSNQVASEAGDHDSSENTRIDLPGLHIQTEGDNASVRLPGVNINARGDNAHISTGIGELKNATIDATDGAVRITSNMTDAGNADQTWMIATDAAGAAGWRTVGYVARGPLTGPLVLATVRSRAEHQHAHSGNGDIEDIRRLVNLSVK